MTTPKIGSAVKLLEVCFTLSDGQTATFVLPSTSTHKLKEIAKADLFEEILYTEYGGNGWDNIENLKTCPCIHCQDNTPTTEGF